MKIEKLIARARGDSIHHGPSVEITLGLIVDGRSMILGRFYEGPHMDGTPAGIADKVWLEMFIDHAVQNFAAANAMKTAKTVV